jgi:hypothetical protein
MTNYFLPPVKAVLWKQLQEENDIPALYDQIVEPLHEEMYRRQNFELMDELTEGQQLMLTYDYVKMQVQQGGFIQLIQNGYVGLLPDMPEWLNNLNINEMANIIDDALKVFVLNREILSKKTTVEEFALLYNELKEFEGIDDRFTEHNEATIAAMVQFALAHPESFVSLI